MEDTTGKEFDVETMEAVTRIPAPDDSMKGKIIDEIERGYYLGNKILRYAKVVVGRIKLRDGKARLLRSSGPG